MKPHSNHTSIHHLENHTQSLPNDACGVGRGNVRVRLNVDVRSPSATAYMNNYRRHVAQRQQRPLLVQRWPHGHKAGPRPPATSVGWAQNPHGAQPTSLYSAPHWIIRAVNTSLPQLVAVAFRIAPQTEPSTTANIERGVNPCANTAHGLAMGAAVSHRHPQSPMIIAMRSYSVLLGIAHATA